MARPTAYSEDPVSTFQARAIASLSGPPNTPRGLETQTSVLTLYPRSHLSAEPDHFETRMAFLLLTSSVPEQGVGFLLLWEGI